MRTPQVSKLIVAGDNPTSPVHVARTAVAAIASYLVARLFHLPEAYWATVSTIVVMQSTLGAALPVSARRFAGTAAGAAVAAAVGTYLGQGVWMFGIGILVIGVLGAAFRIERSAYRYANITLAIVLLVPRSNSVWRIAVHRFFEVSIGIAMGLLLSAVWPERQPGKVDIQKS